MYDISGYWGERLYDDCVRRIKSRGFDNSRCDLAQVGGVDSLIVYTDRDKC